MNRSIRRQLMRRRAGPVDPGRCPMCRALLKGLRTALAAQSPLGVQSVLGRMRLHAVHAHGHSPM